MPTPKSLAGYPDWFFTIAEKALQGNGELLEFDSKGGAITTRRKWYSWRKILDSGGHPLAPELQGVIIRLFQNAAGGWCLHFGTVGELTALSKERMGITNKLVSQDGEDPENIYSLRKRVTPGPVLNETAAEIDKGEEIIARMFGFNKDAVREGSNDVERVPSKTELPKSEGCEHEFLLGRCLKCGIPSSS